MKNRVKFLGVALLCWACASEALTFGRLRGAALVGAPLNVTIQVQVDASEDAISSCFGADVAFGDTTLLPGKVEVTFEPSAQAATARVRLVTRTEVDEPTVSVNVHAKCSVKASRRYVLLADIPSDTLSPPIAKHRATPVPVAAQPIPVASATGMVATKAVRRRAARPVLVKKQVAQPASGPVVDKQPAPAAVAVAVPKVAPVAKEPPPAPVASQPRLQLDRMEAFSDRIVDIDPAIRLAPTEDAVRSLQKKELLESDLKTLRDVTRANEATLQSVKQRLQEAKAQRSSALLVYGLLAALLVALGAMVYLWRRARRVAPPEDKWAQSTSSEHGMSCGESKFGNYSVLEESTLQAEPPTPQDKPPKPSKPRKSLKMNTAGAELADDDDWFSSKVNVTMVEMSDSSFDDLVAKEAEEAQATQAHQVTKEARAPKETRASKESAKPAPGGPGAAPARHTFDRSPDALLDVRHQAQFLVSINRSEQAVALLKQVINEGKEPHPALCMDLIDLLHKLGLKTDYQQRRYQFNHMFNGGIPQFSQFTHGGRDLEGYPQVLSRITALWPTAKAQEYIESCLFPSRDHPLAPAYELAAYRDLVLLHLIAQDIARTLPAGDEAGPVAAATTSGAGSVKPAGNTARSGAAADEVDLDFDLFPSEWHEVRDKPAQEVDISLPVVIPSARPARASVSAITAEPAVAHENLIDFDLSVSPANKPADPGSI